MELLPTRRIVTGDDPTGRSRIVDDGVGATPRTVPDRPGFRSHNLWRTTATSGATDGPDDIATHEGVLPPSGGTIIRVIDFPPRSEDPEERRRQAAASLATLFPDADHQADAQQPGMHRTRTVDYAIVLYGSILAVLDDGETLMSAGDVLIQRGTNHAWENQSGEISRVAFILVDAS